MHAVGNDKEKSSQERIEERYKTDHCPYFGIQSFAGDPSASVLRKEFWNMLLLVVLYMIQGVPLGLTMGAM